MSAMKEKNVMKSAYFWILSDACFPLKNSNFSKNVCSLSLLKASFSPMWNYFSSKLMNLYQPKKDSWLCQKGSNIKDKVPHMWDTEFLDVCGKKHQYQIEPEKISKQALKYKKKLSHVTCHVSRVTCQRLLDWISLRADSVKIQKWNSRPPQNKSFRIIVMSLVLQSLVY